MLGILGGDERCPVARSLDVLGEKWTLMIVRDALLGASRFTQFRRSLGLPREVLTARLASLVDSGVLVRTTYRTEGARPREEYLLTDAGRELAPVLLAMAEWADRHRPAAGGSDLRFADARDGAALRTAVLGDAGTPVPPARVTMQSAAITARWRD